MNIPVFLSYPKPCHSRQEAFVTRIRSYLEERGIAPRTLGVNEYDVDSPLKAVRRLMLESNSIIAIAFRRTYVEKGASRHGTDLPRGAPTPIDGSWLTSPWPHIEVAMAYQLGLPILMLREKGVMADGLLEPGVVGLYMPEFDLDLPLDVYFTSPIWQGVIGKWEGYTRAVVETRGNPPKLY